MINLRNLRAAAFVPVLLLFAGCGGKMSDTPRATESVLSKVSPEAWKRLSSQRIYFGHQSVGYNIVSGIEDLQRTNPAIRLELMEARDAASVERPAFAHSKVGKNKVPKDKLVDFAAIMNGGLGGKVDLAGFKFCYIDFNAKTNVDELFAEYRTTAAGLKAAYPATRFVHFTVPLTVVQGGPKAWIKQVMGKPLWGAAENVKRNQFNEMLRREYSGKDLVFDLAQWESTFPDGSRRSFTSGGKTYYALVDAYASDGEHLNGPGRQWVAAHLLADLANWAK